MCMFSIVSGCLRKVGNSQPFPKLAVAGIRHEVISDPEGVVLDSKWNSIISERLRNGSADRTLGLGWSKSRESSVRKVGEQLQFCG